MFCLTRGILNSIQNKCKTYWNDLLFDFFCNLKIVRALVHRFVLKEPISEFTQDKDPKREKGAEVDAYSKNITLAIVFCAFILSPMTECLGSVLELNVSIFLLL